MSVYLHDIPLSQAQERLKQALQDVNLWRVLGTETVPLDEHALGRVTAEPIWAKLSSPHYHASAMDGFAVRAASRAGGLLVDVEAVPVEEAQWSRTAEARWGMTFAALAPVAGSTVAVWLTNDPAVVVSAPTLGFQSDITIPNHS